MWDIIVMEVRLQGNDPSVDFLLGSVRRENSPAAVAECLNNGRHFPGLGDSGVATPLLKAWSENGNIASDVPLVWLEFDLPSDGETRLGTGLAVNPAHYKFDLAPTPAVQAKIAQWGYELITGHAANPLLMTMLEKCARALPSLGAISYVAPLEARGSVFLRLVANLPVTDVTTWLQAIGWQGEGLEKLMHTVGTDLGNVGVQIEISEDRVSDYLAIESYLLTGTHTTPAATKLVERLNACGASEPERTAPMLAWLGEDFVQGPGEWTKKLPRSCVLKTVLKEGRLEAKGYLEFSLSHVVSR